MIYTATCFIGASLLFLVQPMTARLVLPRFGGTPAVWNTCLVFFQCALLAGYAYADATARWLSPRRQALLHVGILLVPWLVLPIRLDGTEDSGGSIADPASWLLGRLVVRAGPPFVLVAATAPLLQRWLAATAPSGERDPYWLYVASNAGSLLALVTYPTLVEPAFGLERQAGLWGWGFGVLSVGMAGCASVVWWGVPAATPHPDKALATRPGDAWRLLEVLGLAFIPSSLMLGVTTYVTTDIAAVPMLWIVPLVLYLLSFMLTFARRPVVSAPAMVHLLAITAIILTLSLAAGLAWRILVPVHVAAFFAAAMVCHGAIAARRPAPERLTTFYLALATGGALGGIFNALVAPTIFQRVAEYPLGIVLACAVLPRSRSTTTHGERTAIQWRRTLVLPAVSFLATALAATGTVGRPDSALPALLATIACGAGALACTSYRSRPVRFALTLGAVLLASSLTEGVNGRPLLRERDFFGTLKVTEIGTDHLLFHGRTLHGQQSFDPRRRREPLTYFTTSGPIGQVFQVPAVHRPGARVAVVGLGVGSLASYARGDQSWTFYEIDPAVVRVALDPRFFTYLADCRSAGLQVLVGDGRLRLSGAAESGYDLIVLDAFSSDAVPVHLLTREALATYRTKLSSGGVLVYNLSTRYVDLEPVLGALARDLGWTCLVRRDLDVTAAEKAAGKQPSIWCVLASRSGDLGGLTRDARWRPARVPAGERVWTDDRADLLWHFQLGLR
jgi:hypothetical protein